ncbi:unnamed protein product [Polarella glacialis]|uniref:Uncharacterized protein n=1 Tax=Polarella glacialis TaxID=89957 RepID=A0A813F303_POLGL|nr:unnamed protein product [Polarella glacialis]
MGRARKGASAHAAQHPGTSPSKIFAGALISLAVWRYAGGTQAFISRVGYIQAWSCTVEQGLRQTLLSYLGSAALADCDLYRGYAPPRVLYMHALSNNVEAYSQEVDRVLADLKELATEVIPTLAWLIQEAPCTPMVVMAALACTVRFFGAGGTPGHHHSGPFGACTSRRPGFWTNLWLGDAALSGALPWTPPDLELWAASGPGTARGLCAAAGRSLPEDADGKVVDAPRGVADDAVSRIRQLLVSQGTCRSALQVSFGFCEVSKVYADRARTARRKVRGTAAPTTIGTFKHKAARWTCACQRCRRAARVKGGAARGTQLASSGWCSKCWKGRHQLVAHCCGADSATGWVPAPATMTQGILGWRVAAERYLRSPWDPHFQGVPPGAMKDDAIAATGAAVVTVVSAAVAAIARGADQSPPASLQGPALAPAPGAAALLGSPAPSQLHAMQMGDTWQPGGSSGWPWGFPPCPGSLPILMPQQAGWPQWPAPMLTGGQQLPSMSDAWAGQPQQAQVKCQQPAPQTARSHGAQLEPDATDSESGSPPTSPSASPSPASPVEARQAIAEPMSPGASLLRETAATEKDLAETVCQRQELKSSRTGKTFWYRPATKASSYEMPPDVAQRAELQHRLVRRQATLDSMTVDLGPTAEHTPRDNLSALPAKGVPGLASMETASPRAALLQDIDALEREIPDATSPYTQRASVRTGQPYWYNAVTKVSSYSMPEALGRKLELQTRLQALKTELQKAVEGAKLPHTPAWASAAGSAGALADTRPKTSAPGGSGEQDHSLWRTGVEVKFMAGISTAAQLHRRLEAMGVHILDSADGEALAGQPLPFGTPKGQRTQPAVEVTFAMAPKVTAMTVQVHTRQQCVAWKGKRGSFEANKETIMLFFGEVSSVTASAPSKEKSRDVVEHGSHSALDMWKVGIPSVPCFERASAGGRRRVLCKGCRTALERKSCFDVLVWTLYCEPGCSSYWLAVQRHSLAMDEAVLRAAAMAFQASGPSELLVGAAIKDFAALLQAAPRNPQTLWRTNSGPRQLLQPLAASVACVKGVLKYSALPALRHMLGHPCAVVSPYMSGIPAEDIWQLGSGASTSSSPLRTQQLILASANPGRAGLAHLGSDEVLWWRVWLLGASLLREGVHICVLPGARWPPGAVLPPGFPYIWLGQQSTSWDSAGVWVSTELEGSVAVEEKLGGARCMWLHVGTQEQTEKTKLILGAVYPEHGGDIAAWTGILQDYALLAAKFPERRILIMGDCNFHISAFLAHRELCRCAHCSHVSGAAIDLILGRGGMPLPVAVLPERVADSDHHIVIARLPAKISLDYGHGIGRVSLADSEAWTDALATIDQCLGAAADALELATTEMSDAYSTGAPTGRRRAVLNAAAWLRDALFVFAGHCCGATRGKPARSQGRHRTLVPEDLTDLADPGACQDPLEQLCFCTRAKAAARYAHLCLTDPPGAARFMAMYFRQQKQFTIALVDAEGASLDGPGMVAAVVDNLHARVGIDNGRRDSAEERSQAEFVELIRAARAPRSGVSGIGPRGSRTTGGGAERYSAEEMATARTTIKEGKTCIRGSYAAILADSESGARITLAAVNLGRACRLTATEWSLRRFIPLRKCGPRMVRHADNLRPISLSTDVAAVQDALWLLRCRAVLEQFTGPEQVGGKSDVQSMLLAMVIHAQLRMRHGMPTYWVFADLKWAFDLMTLDCLRLTCYEAGVVEDDWALVDDMLAQDRQCVQLLHYLSHTFALGRGAAQGRKPQKQRDPPGLAAAPDTQLCQHVADVLLAAARSEGPPWRRTEVLAVQLLSGMTNMSSRIQVLELMGSDPIGPLQLVDDTTAICPSAGAAAAVVLIGCEMGCPVVATYRNLGVLLDANLSFEPRLTELCRLGAALCGEVLQTARAGCFPLQAHAAQIPVRVETVVLFGAELLLEIDRAEGVLNRMQHSWARSVLGCGAHGRAKGLLAVAQCGWTVRLGTLFLEQVLVAQARARVLPVDRPLSRTLAVADNSLALTWARAAKHLLQSPKWSEPIPDICDSLAFAPEELSAARECPVVRRGVMRRYRCEVLRPILQEYDRTALVAVASEVITGIGVAYERFQCGVLRGALGSYPEPQLPLPTKFLQASALVRISGKWPAVLWNGRSLLETLPRCPRCARTDVGVRHVVTCPATAALRQDMVVCAGGYRPGYEDILLLDVLTNEGPAEHWWEQINFLGKALSLPKRWGGNRLADRQCGVRVLRVAEAVGRQPSGATLVVACVAPVTEALGRQPRGATPVEACSAQVATALGRQPGGATLVEACAAQVAAVLGRQPRGDTIVEACAAQVAAGLGRQPRGAVLLEACAAQVAAALGRQPPCAAQVAAALGRTLTLVEACAAQVAAALGRQPPCAAQVAAALGRQPRDRNAGGGLCSAGCRGTGAATALCSAGCRGAGAATTRPQRWWRPVQRRLPRHWGGNRPVQRRLPRYWGGNHATTMLVEACAAQAAEALGPQRSYPSTRQQATTLGKNLRDSWGLRSLSAQVTPILKREAREKPPADAVREIGHAALDKSARFGGVGVIGGGSTLSQLSGNKFDSTAGHSERALTSTLAADLRLAVSLPVVLHRFGQELRSSAARHSSQGTQVERIGTFISHDWGSSGSLKFMALLLRFNSRAAAVMAVGVSLVVGFLEAFHFVSCTTCIRNIGGAVYITRESSLSFPSGLVAYCIILFSWQRILSLRGRSAMVFLDKLCIDQQNEARKERGILGLAGFLEISDELVILWSPSYFGRLWCTYELASWLRFSQLKDITVIPIHLAPVLLCIALSMWGTLLCYIEALTIAYSVAGSHTVELAGLFLGSMCITVGAILPTHISRHLAKSLGSLPQQLEHFSIREAKSFCCSHKHVHPETQKHLPCDRRLIFDMLEQWQYHFSDSRREYASSLDSFDFHVRQKLKPWILRNVGGAEAPFSLLLATTCVPFFCWTISYIPALIELGGVPAFRLGLEAALYSIVFAPCVPKIILEISAAGVDCEDLGRCDLLYTLLKSTAFVGLTSLIWAGIHLPLTIPEHVGWQLASAAGLVALIIAIVRRPNCRFPRT